MFRVTCLANHRERMPLPATDQTSPTARFDWWNSLRHGGMLIDAARLSTLLPEDPRPLSGFELDRLRRRIVAFDDAKNPDRGKFVSFVFDAVCGFATSGQWSRGNQVEPDRWARKTLTGEVVKPNHLWLGPRGGRLPVFIDSEKRVGVGRGKRLVADTLRWLRAGDESLAIVTNGRQWRLVLAGLDYEAFCEWDVDRWLEGGAASDELLGLRSLLDPRLWTPPTDDTPAPLLAAIQESRKGQAELSQVLGERVRQAVESLIRAHSPLLDELQADTATPDSSPAPDAPPAPEPTPVTDRDIYHAAVRVVMRLVVTLFAESREGLLPKDNVIFHDSYSLQGLRDQLERVGALRRKHGYSAYPRIVSLFRLIYEGCSHEALPVPGYGGQLFQPGDFGSADGVRRALAVLEQGCYAREIVDDAKVYEILDLLSRTKIKIRQGRGGTWMPSPVDFSRLDSEYIGILYEGLLDFELRVAGDHNPVIFLAVGNQPALPLSTLEAMDDRALKNLLETLKDTSSGDEEAEDAEDDAEESDEQDDAAGSEDVAGEEQADTAAAEETDGDDEGDVDDVRQTTRVAAEQWARRAIAAGKLVKKPRGRMTPEKEMQYQDAIDRKARQIITKVVLPGERYLVRWGGTRKGSGTFYTRPQLAVPTVHRTLRPLAYDPPADNADAPLSDWTPKRPEQILELKVCDPACGSGSFPLAALRFLTEALYTSLQHHERFKRYADRTVIELIAPGEASRAGGEEGTSAAGQPPLATENLPCRPEDDDFESRTKAVLRRYVVERCVYGVDIDPLAVELCRMSLWIETLDPRLPFTFLDHKIKCGNALIGTWFDQFLHYPAMAWMREGGDKTHTGGVHFEKEAWTKAIRGKVKQVKNELIEYIDGATLIYKVDLSTIETTHNEAERALQEIHRLGVHEAEERAVRYQDLRNSPEFRKLKNAFDLWCAIWFWPPDKLEACPLPLDFYERNATEEAQQIAGLVCSERRFFHWELEFPDVFNQTTHGFDAVLGNPPWETLQPNSKEYFSALDPLYRSYGNQEAKRYQREYFENAQIESGWLKYNVFYKEFATWMKHSGAPFGNALKSATALKGEHDFPIGDRGRRSFESSATRHDKWKQKREEITGYTDAEHAFCHQGRGKPYTQKMFLEISHAILREGGRLGMIVPSGIYSDHGTGELRSLFLERCKWEWLFGFENREGIFDIHRSFKFNPIIVQKGGQTDAIRTAFMRRDLNDWEDAERYVTDYPRERVVQFSPRSRAILEIQSSRDLEVLEKIYSNSVLLGDDGPDGWGIKYAQGDFNMTSDSKLFPPRDQWEARGYRPDEYSRWLKGNWRPIEELWQQLGVDPSRPHPLDPACQRRVEHAIAEGEAIPTGPNALLKSTDCFPIPRADFPDGVIVSRDRRAFLHESEVYNDTFIDKQSRRCEGRAVSLPLYQGAMLSQLSSNNQQYKTGRGNRVAWSQVDLSSECEMHFEPQFLISEKFASDFAVASRHHRYLLRNIARTTDARTIIGSPCPPYPAGHSLAALSVDREQESSGMEWGELAGILSSLVFDWEFRNRLGGTNVSFAFLSEAALPKKERPDLGIAEQAVAVALPGVENSVAWCRLSRIASLSERPMRQYWALSPHERLRRRVVLDAIVALRFKLSMAEYRHILQDCDLPVNLVHGARLYSKGFWRVDRVIPPERRFTTLSIVAFAELCGLVESFQDERAAVKQFLSQCNGEGWQLPETLRLADYGLGHDERAKEHQPVRECFGPRWYDWQLAQSPEESWRECHLHARNLLGPDGYQALLDEIAGKEAPEPSGPREPGSESRVAEPPTPLFDSLD